MSRPEGMPVDLDELERQISQRGPDDCSPFWFFPLIRDLRNALAVVSAAEDVVTRSNPMMDPLVEALDRFRDEWGT